MIIATIFAVALASPPPSSVATVQADVPTAIDLSEPATCEGGLCGGPLLARVTTAAPRKRVGKRVRATRGSLGDEIRRRRAARKVPGAPQRVWFQDEPASDVKFAGTMPGGDRWPLLSFGRRSPAFRGFCVIEDAKCGVSLLLDADVGAGIEIAAALDNYSVPYTQYRIRGGVSFRPISLATSKWTPWTLGMSMAWSEGSRTLARDRRSSDSDQQTGLRERDPIRALRVSMINQLWLSQRRFAPHIDLSIGGVQSSVLDATGRYWGTSVEVGFGFGGAAQLFASMDFLDRNFRGILGFRSHAIAAGPIAGLVILGMLAGGAI